MSARQGGFTLIEVVVAFAILAVSLGALYQSFSLTLRQSDRSERRELALLRAQSLLARVGADLPLQTGKITGEDGRGLSWTIEIADFPPPDPDSRWPVQAYDVTVTVDWGRDPANQVSLHSLELGRQP